MSLALSSVRSVSRVFGIAPFTFGLRAGTRSRRWRGLMLAVLAVLGLNASVALAATATTTTLAVTSTSSASAITAATLGTEVTLTATVKAGATGVTLGQVYFCDATASFCSDVHIVAKTMLTSAGTASYTFYPGVAVHQYKAFFVGTGTYTTSTSGTSMLTVSGVSGSGLSVLGSTSTSLTKSGTTGNYSLTATTTGIMLTSPTGQETYVDVTNGNATLGTASVAATTPTFVTQTLLAAAYVPQAIASGDFNSDGFPDLAIATNCSVNVGLCGGANVIILLGKADGSFQVGTPVVSGFDAMTDIEVADFNGDGIPDLAVVDDDNLHSATQHDQVFLGKGDGTFQAAKNYDFGSTPNPQFQTVGDFNNDGKLDIAVATLEGGSGNVGSVNILLGNGDGTFTKGAVLNANASTYQVAGIDYNGDGKLDLIAGVSSVYNVIQKYKGDGTGGFTADGNITLGAGFSVGWVQVADVNQDGLADLVVVDTANNKAHVLLGDGAGNFTDVGTTVPTGYGAGPLAVIDLNNDGKLDLAVTNYTDNTVTVNLGNGDGTFGPTVATLTTGSQPYDIIAGYFGSNGAPGFAVPNYDDNSASTFLTQQVSTGTLTGVAIPGTTGTHQVAAVYSGDSNNHASTSGQVTLNVGGGAVAPTATQAVASAALTVNTAATSFTPVTGSGGTGALSYGVSPGLPTGLSFSTTTGAISGTPTVTSATGTYTVTITDTASKTATNTFSLTVNSAVTATQSIAAKSLTVNQSSVNFTPVTGGGGTTPLSYSVSPGLPSGLAISTSTGAITGTPTATLASTTFTVTVTDANSATATNTFSLTVNSGVTATQAVAAKSLTANQSSVNFTPVTGGGGTTPLSYGVSPSLPAGLTISSSTGAITGVPTATLAATTFTVTVTDANSATATNTFSLTVNPAVTATQSIATKSLTVNQTSANFTPINGGGGTTPLSYGISPGLPAGLAISSTTGAITGSPTASSSATTYTVTVTDANSATATNTFSLTVNAAVAAAGGTYVATLTQNHATTPFTPVTGSGGTTPLTYSVSPGLPTGLSINPSTGAVSGTPTAISVATTYTVTVTDANSATATNTFILSVNAAVAATQVVGSNSGTQDYVLLAYIPVAGSGGTGTLTYSISPALPAGLTFNTTTGGISGTPTVVLNPGTLFTVTVTDTNSATASNTTTLTIYADVSTTQIVASKVLTQNHAATFTPVTGSGGTGALTYSVLPLLPAGLSISSTTGAITGTPSTTLAATTFTVTVTDTRLISSSKSFSLTINPAVTATQSIASKALTQNFAASFTPVAGGGGTTPLSYGISPSLPAGLSLNTSTGLISGTPTVTLAATTFTVTVTDVNSAAATNTFSLTVNPAVTATQAVASKSLTQNFAAVPFTPVTGGGGTGTLSYGISPAVPTGLTFSTTTGLISGTSTVVSAATSYTITVTDTNGASATNSFSLTVNPAVTATQSVASKALTENQPPANYTPVTGGGGTTPLAFGISPALPAGLSFSTTTGAVTGTPTGTSAAVTYTVTVTDANGAAATNSFSLSINPPVTAVTVVASVALTQNHADAPFTPVNGGGGTVPLTYTTSPLLPTGMSINPSTGSVSGAPGVTLATTVITVTATDINGATASSTFTLTVNPAVTATQNVASKSLTQNQTIIPFTPVSGANGTGTLTYSLSPALPAGLSFNTTTGAITGTPTVTFAPTSFTVVITDTNGATGVNSFSLTVNPAVVATLSVAAEMLTQNHAITPFTPAIGGGGTGTLTYSILPALPTGLTLNSSTGVLSGTPTVTLVTTVFTVSVTDSNGAAATTHLTLTVNAAVTATQTVATKALTQNNVATAYIPVTGGGGTIPLVYSLSPAIPAGLVFSTSTETISGTPTGTLAATTFTVTVTDANNASATNTFSLTINSAVTATQAVATKVVTQNRIITSFTPVTGAGGTGALTYVVTPALPLGLSISATTGLISGTPTVATPATTYTVTVTDINNATASATFSLTVNTAVTATQQVASTSLTQNFAASPFTPVLGGGGTTPLTYSVSPGLPAGLTFNTSTGAVTGTPTGTSPATTYTVTVTDANGATGSATFSLTINVAVSATKLISTTVVLTANVVVPVFTPVTGSGGTGVLHYSVSPALPAGVVIGSTTGTISGTPTVAAPTTTYTVTVTDANGATATATFSMVVNPAVTATQTVATKVLTLGQPAISYTPVTGGGGTAPIVFSVSPALPAGLSLNSTNGVVSGSPTIASAATTYTITVIDANNASATANFSITVSVAIATLVPVPSTVLTQGQPSVTFTPVTATGGTGALTYSVLPILPAGLSFNATTGTVSGVSTVSIGLTNYTVTVTDVNGATATGSFTLLIYPAVQATVAVPSITLIYATPTTFTPVVGSGGDTPLAYSISPSLPTGLNFSPTTGTITGSSAALATTTYTVTITDINSGTASGNFTLTVNPAASGISLSSNATSITPVQQVTFTVNVTNASPGSTGIPSGTALFFDSGVQIGSSPVTAGVATYSTLLSAGATHLITASYSGNGNFLASATSNTITVTVATLEFTLTPVTSLSQPLYVIPGNSTSFNFTITSLYGSFPGTVNYTLTGLPNGATYSFSPASLPATSAGGGVTATISVPTNFVASNRESGKYAPLLAGLLLLPLLGIRRSRKKLGMLVLLLMVGGMMSAITGCSTNGDGILKQSPSSYNVTLTVTSGAISHSQGFTLIVE